SVLSEWKVRKICDAGWIMSLVPVYNKIGVLSELYVTDRKKETKAAKHFLNIKGAFTESVIGSADQEPMFMDLADFDQDGLLDVVLATYSDVIDVHRQAKQGWKFSAESWTIKMPPNTGTGKSVGIGDIDLDGDMDIAFTCGNSEGKHGVMWLSYRESPKETEWVAHDIGGLTGTKFDRLVLIDLDNDGDLDLLTCEERENLGVIWYENPIHP
ncbi:FG-GAP-like repeat-containing protein, partial [bacterium]|nr:FG-GAP-like repeat-containing protein [bacterium]